MFFSFPKTKTFFQKNWRSAGDHIQNIPITKNKLSLNIHSVLNYFLKLNLQYFPIAIPVQEVRYDI